MTTLSLQAVKAESDYLLLLILGFSSRWGPTDEQDGGDTRPRAAHCVTPSDSDSNPVPRLTTLTTTAIVTL